MPEPWLTWWLVLCAAAVVNVVAWRASALALGLHAARFPVDIYAARRMLLWLSAVYVLGCGFRSVFPMVDVPRICLHDTWVSRIFVGRTVATVAELAFAVQWAILLREAGAAAGSAFVSRVARAVVPVIAAAEICSWGAVLTTNNLLHAAENSLWTLAALLSVGAALAARRRVDAPSARVLTAVAAGGAAYVAYMVVEDVPMYLARWQADLAAGHQYLTLGAGLRELLERCVVTRDWDAWRDDVTWLTLYFTVCVWISVTLPHTPPLRRHVRAGER